MLGSVRHARATASRESPPGGFGVVFGAPRRKVGGFLPMEQYHQLLRLVLDKGRFKADRTGTGTYAVFGAQARFDLRDSFPLLTTKKLHLRSIIHELLWFLKVLTPVESILNA